MNAPQIILLVFLGLKLVINMTMHGKHHKEPVNFWLVFSKTLVLIMVLYWGGFFNA